MRLMIATDAWHPQVNGVVRTMTQVCAKMTEYGHEVRVISPSEFRSIPCPGYPEIPLAFASARQMAKLVDKYQPDAIHIATEGPVGQGMRRACIRNGWKFTSAFHTRFPEYIRARMPVPLSLTHFFMRRFHNAAHAVLVPTRSIMEDLEQRGYAGLKLWTRGVDRNLFSPHNRRELDVPRPIFMNVGRLATEKNLPDFLKLDLPGTKVVVGDGPQRAELEAKFSDVVFLGAKHGAELAELLASADVFVFPSRTDTFGLVILEALASGVPVAAYPVPGPKDILQEAGASAGVVSEDLREAALAALKLGPVTPDAVLESFSWDACAEIFANTLVPRLRK